MSLIDNKTNKGIVLDSGLASNAATGHDAINIESTFPPEIEDRKKLIEWHTAEEVAEAILWQHKDHTVLAPTGMSKQNDFSTYKSAAEEFIKMIYWTYGIDLEFCLQKTIFCRGDGKPNLEIKDRPVKGNSLRFHCKKCKVKNNQFSLVAWGKCVQTEDGNRGIQIQKMFFHDNICCPTRKHMQLPDGYHPNPIQRIVEIDYDNIFGTSYDCLVQKLEQYDGSNIANDWPPGDHINLGKQNLPVTDNRAYQLLPATEADKYPELSEAVHKGCMIRLLYHMAATFNISEEVAPQIFDLEESLDKDGQFNGRIGCKDRKNPNCHLYFTEVSLLFGGHHQNSIEWRDQLTHQLCHMDGETGQGMTLNENPHLVGRTKPGSFILPIKNLRSFYMWCVENLQWIYKGQYVFFSGNVPHGGTTRKIRPGSNDGREWHPAIHGHLDSICHKRDAASVNREQKFRHYFPPVHWPYVPPSVVVDHFLARAKEIAQLIDFLIRTRTRSALWLFEELRKSIFWYYPGNDFSTFFPNNDLENPPPEDDGIADSPSVKRKRSQPNRFSPSL